MSELVQNLAGDDCVAIVGVGSLPGFAAAVPMIKMIMGKKVTPDEIRIPQTLAPRFGMDAHSKTEIFTLIDKGAPNPMFLVVDWCNSAKNFMELYNQLNMFVVIMIMPNLVAKILVDGEDVSNSNIIPSDEDFYRKELEMAL